MVHWSGENIADSLKGCGDGGSDDEAKIVSQIKMSSPDGYGDSLDRDTSIEIERHA